MRNIANPNLTVVGAPMPHEAPASAADDAQATPLPDRRPSGGEPAGEPPVAPTGSSLVARLRPFGGLGPSGDHVAPPVPAPAPSPIDSLLRSASIGRHPQKKVIAVIGAAGAAGRGLINAVLEDKESQFVIRAITPRLDSDEGRFLGTLGTEVVAGVVDDEASLLSAFSGAFAAFHLLLSSEHPFPDTRIAEANAVARAAKGAGLQRVIWATLEDPGQTSLQQDDLTPTFKDGRWANQDPKNEAETVFTALGVPTTFLQTSWDPSVAAGKWTEGIGKCAYGILRSGEPVGGVVSTSATELAKSTAHPVAAPTAAPVAAPAAASIATPVAASVPAPTAASIAALAATSVKVVSSPQPRSRTPLIAIAAVIVVGSLLALVVARQRGRDRSDVPPTAMEVPRAPAEVPPNAARAGSSEQHSPPTPEPARPSESYPPTPVVAMLPPSDVAPSTRNVTKRVSPQKRRFGEAPKPAAQVSAPPSPAPPTLHEPLPLARPEPVAARVPSINPPPPSPPPLPATAPPGQSEPPRTATEAPRLAASRPPGFVEPRAVTATVRAHAAEAQACYERAIMDHPDLHGRLTMNATVDPTGHVMSAAATSTIAGGARLESCVSAAFKSWVFPAPTGGVNGNITYSFSFKSGS